MKTSWTFKCFNWGLIGSIALLAVQSSANAIGVATKTTLVSSLNPAPVGGLVTLTAEVSPATAGGTVPSGTVTFSDGTTVIGTVRLNRAGKAPYSTANFSMGSHFFTASYDGDANYETSQSSSLIQLITKPETTVTLKSSSNPVPVGEAVTVTATVAPTVAPTVSGASAPTGSVMFKDGSVTLAILSLSGGEVSYSAAMTLGSHPVTATYYGDSDFSPSTSTILTQVVTKASATLALSSSLNPSTAGQSVSFSAVVSAPSASSAPSGTVQFQVDGANFGRAVALVKGSAESESTATLTQGNHVVGVIYSGDNLFKSCSDTTGSQTVNPTSATCVAANNGPLCTGATLQLSGTTSDTGAGVFFSWTGPNGFRSSLKNPTIANVTTANAGKYVLTAGTTLSTNCVVQTVVTIAPPVNVAILGDNNVCPNSTNTFRAPASLDSYAWSVQGAATIVGSARDQIVHVTAGAGCETNFVISLTAAAGSCSKTVSQTVAVADAPAPVITAFPADATFPCADFLPAADDNLVKASHGCGGLVTISHAADVISKNVCSNRFTVARVYTATDSCGHAASRTQTITIDDTEGPAFAGVPKDTTVNNVAVPPANTLVAVDNCEGNPEVVFNETKAPGSSASNYFLIRTWTATDACGNRTVVTQKITVNATGAQASR